MNIYEILKVVLADSSGPVNKYNICLDIIDILDRNGYEVNSQLVEALHQGEDHWANNIVNIEINKIEEKNKAYEERERRIVAHLKSIPGLPSIGRAVSDEELDAAMEHGLRVMCDPKEFNFESAMTAQLNEETPSHLTPLFKSGDVLWDVIEWSWDDKGKPKNKAQQVKIVDVDKISDDMFDCSRGVVYNVEIVDHFGPISPSNPTIAPLKTKVHQFKLFKTQKEAEEAHL